MKSNEFFDAMGKIDPELIEHAEKKSVKRRPFMRIAAIAASFAVLAVGFVAALPMLFGDEPLIVQDVIVWENLFQMFAPGNGDGLTVGESRAEEEIIITENAFAEIVSEAYSDYKIGSVIPIGNNGAAIGEKLGEVEIRSGWYNRAEDVEKDVTTVRAEVYEIGGVARESAVAIRYLEKCAANSDYYSYYYYVAVNENYELTTLSELFDDLNADTYLKMSNYALLLEVPGDPAEKLNIVKYQFKDGAGETMRDLILSLDGDGKIVGYYDEAVTLKKGTKTLELSFVMQTSKRGIHNIYVFEDGRIAISGMSDGVAIFNIGVDSTDALFAAFAENAELSTDRYTEDDLVEAVTGEVNE